MNAKRRNAISALIGQIDDIKGQLETFRDEEQEQFDNMGERAQEGDKGQDVERRAEALNSACDDLDNVISQLNDASDE